MLIGSWFKLNQMGLDPTWGMDGEVPRVFWLCLAAFEAVAAWALLVNFRPSITKPVCLLLYLSFVAYLINELRLGNESCGCMGALNIPPTRMLVIDAAMAIGLFFWKPVKSPVQSLRSTLITCWFAPFFIIAIWQAAFVHYKTIDEIKRDGNGGPVVLNPESWKNQAFPLTNWVEDGSILNSGKHEILFVKSGCAICKRVVEEECRKDRSSELILIHVDPVSQSPYSSFSGVTITRLSQKNRWFMTTPTKVTLDDGKVVDVKSY